MVYKRLLRLDTIYNDTVGERCFNVRCNAVYVPVNFPNQCPSMVPLLRRFSSDPAWVFWTVTMSISSSCIRRARYSLFEIEIPLILIWQILRFDFKDRGSFHLNLNLNLSFVSSLKPCYGVDCWYSKEGQCAWLPTSL
jgi:hypothetical protein